MRIYIPGNVPSLKNSKQWTGSHLVPSKTVQRYKKEAGPHYLIKKKQFLEMVENRITPLYLSFHFIRDSRRKFDFHNAVQIVLDMMTEYGWIPDDNADEVVPFFLPYSYQKGQGGVYISTFDTFFD